MVDGVILAILLVFMIAGYHRGLIRTVVTLGSSIAALALSFIVYPAVNAILKVTALYIMIYTGVLEKVEKIDFGKGVQSQGKAITSNIKWLPDILTDKIISNNNTAMYEILNVHSIQEYISTYVTNMIISMIAILITWFLIKIVLMWGLRTSAGIIEKLPVVSNFNHLGGAIIGIIKGLLTLSIIALIIPTMINIPNFSEIGTQIQDSFLAQQLYNHNLVIGLYNYFMGK